MRNSYTNWIARDKLGLSVKFRNDYSLLIETLFDTDFIWNHKEFPFDENRAIDGVLLREEYFEDIFGEDIFMTELPCSVLEMLASFVIRIEDEYIGDPNHPEYDHLFLELLNNLGLLYFTNSRFSQKKVDEILENWMKRRCEKNVRNVKYLLFPLKKLKVNQLERDLWSQMQAYLTENY